MLVFRTQCYEFETELRRRKVAAGLDFLKVVRLVFWSGVVGPGFRSLALRAHSRATRSKARLVSKSTAGCEGGK